MFLPTSEVRKCALQVLDFNVRSALDDNEHEGTSKKKNNADPWLHKTTLKRVTYPTRITTNMFVDVVGSELPYHEARRDIRDDYSAVMIGWSG